MKKLNLWMPVAILTLCGAVNLTSCSSDSDDGGDKPLGVEINAANFPNANFRAIVGRNDIDKDQNGYLSDAEINAVTKLGLDQAGIDNLKGVNYFTNLTELYCADNNLASIDISKLVKLEKLGVDHNALTQLDVSKNVNLKELWCYENKITQLDVTKNTKLTLLSCYDNQLTQLNVSKNLDLAKLWCFKNQLSSLDVKNLTKLTLLHCNTNKIGEAAMGTLVEGLPIASEGEFVVISDVDENDQNVITSAQISVAKSKGWIVIADKGDWKAREL